MTEDPVVAVVENAMWAMLERDPLPDPFVQPRGFFLGLGDPYDAHARITFIPRQWHACFDTGGGCIVCGRELLHPPPKPDSHLWSHFAQRPTLGEALRGAAIPDPGECPVPGCWSRKGAVAAYLLR